MDIVRCVGQALIEGLIDGGKDGVFGTGQEMNVDADMTVGKIDKDGICVD